MVQLRMRHLNAPRALSDDLGMQQLRACLSSLLAVVREGTRHWRGLARCAASGSEYTENFDWRMARLSGPTMSVDQVVVGSAVWVCDYLERTYCS